MVQVGVYIGINASNFCCRLCLFIATAAAEAYFVRSSLQALLLRMAEGCRVGGYNSASYYIMGGKRLRCVTCCNAVDGQH